MNYERLLNVAKALRESPAPDTFTMKRYGHYCGTPACALGHYAARADLQNSFFLSDRGTLRVLHGDPYDTLEETLRHFEITRAQEDWLFGCNGCGDAETPLQAAEFIERFVAEHSGR